MKAIVCYRYGLPEVLQLTDLPIPEPTDCEVRVLVRATTINDWDWSLVRGKPYPYRSFYGISKPKQPIFGVELAGIVDAVGSAVTGFKIGDEVYGDISGHGWGTWAEYVCVKESDIVHKPREMNFTEAAALPHASILAWQGLVDAGHLKQGQKILINGAGGGVGACAVQIAKTFGAHITGVDHGDKFTMMGDLGFDQVLDYRKQDFTKSGEQFDLILDAKTMKWPLSYLRVLKPTGRYITIGGGPARLLQILALKPIVSLITKKHLQIVALKPNKGLEHIDLLYKEGKIKPIIDGPYPFEAIPEQLARFGDGKHLGKIVITV